MLLKSNEKGQRTVNAIDCPMGSGKTSAAIEYINSLPENEKVVYAGVYNDEARRVRDACKQKDVYFVEEDKYGNKTPMFHEAVTNGLSTACTHALMLWFDKNILADIARQNYTLIIDEAYSVLRYTTMSEQKQFFFLLDHGAIHVDDETGKVSFINETESKSCSGLNGDLTGFIDRGYVYFINKKIIIWVFPVDVLNAFHRVIVMSYMLDAQPMYYYLLCNNYKVYKFGVRKTDDDRYEFCKSSEADGFGINVKEKIHIFNDVEYNRIGKDRTALSSTWYDRNSRNNTDEFALIRSHIRNMYKNRFACSAKDYMWTCYGKHRSKIEDKNIRRGFVPFNARAMNDYGNRHYLAYAIDAFIHPDAYNYFKSFGYYMDMNKWALSVMLQWIWRSAIRNKEEIWIYVPSKRMRALLTSWIDLVSEGGDESEL